MLKMLDKIQSADNEARDFVDRGVRANHLAALIAAGKYNKQLKNREVSHAVDIAAAVQEPAPK